MWGSGSKGGWNDNTGKTFVLVVTAWKEPVKLSKIYVYTTGPGRGSGRHVGSAGLRRPGGDGHR